MQSRIALFFLLAVGLIFGLLFARQVYLSRGLPREKFVEKKLRLLTYSTFVGGSGPGGEVIKRFKAEHNCDVEVITAGDAGLLVERLRISEASSPFDAVVGLDQYSSVDAKAKMQWRPVTVSHEDWQKDISATDDRLVPFDWSPMTFVYRKDVAKEPPRTLNELTDARFKGQFAVQDPRASSPGLQFYNWVRAVEGEGTIAFLEKFKPNVQSISPSWAFSYGLFKKGQAVYVFSYLTSLGFHWGLEKDRNYQVLSFPEGHPIQVEFAGVPATCRECPLGEAFVRTLLEPWAQKLIMEKNFMFPVRAGIDQGTVFADLPKLKVREVQNPTEKDFSDWDKVFKR